MIDVKIIKKPKNTGSTSAIKTSGTAYGGMAVMEAAHAAKADIAELAKEATHAEEADHSLQADQSGEAEKAAYADEAGHAKEADHATEADNADKWDSRQFDDYLDQPVRKEDHVTFSSVTSDTIRSAAEFVDGLTGEGFRLWRDEDGLTYLCLDRLTVRQTMTVFELLIDKVRSVGGQICVSAANGKIKEIYETDLNDTGDAWHISFETENTFQAGDLMRCQTFTGNAVKYYWVEVASVDSSGIVVSKAEFNGVEPSISDECVLMGSTSNKKRQNLILISATEDGQPRIDVLDGVSGKNFDDALRVRLGNLDGINDDRFPADHQPNGNGIYSDNAFLKGTFLLATGEDIKTKFEITEGKITSAIEGLRQDFVSEKGYLNNSTFYDGLSKWQTENSTVFFLVGNKWVWANKKPLSKRGDGATVTTDDGRTVVRIKNKYIQQLNKNLRTIPDFDTNAKGEKEAIPVYLSFFYRCAEAGTLTVAFENVDKTGFADFDSMNVSEELSVTEGYKQYTCNGLWNGTGDFKLSFTGDIYLYMLVLSTDKIESLTYKYKTLFEQSERLVRISAAVYDKDENALKETGLFIKPEGAGLYAQDADGKVALVGVSVDETDAEGNKKSVVKLTADNIQLEGLVTANENFKILEDGSIEAKNGSFKGKIDADSGSIGGFAISYGHIGMDYTAGDGAPTDNENGGLFLNANQIGFNQENRQTIVGTWQVFGTPVLARFLDNVEDFSARYGIVTAVRGSLYDNVALNIGGGYVQGLALKPKIIGLGSYTSEKKPGDLNVTLDRTETVVYAATKYSWRAKESDDYTSLSRNVYVTLPEMQHYDDGHVIKIKRGPGDGAVYLKPGKTNWKKTEKGDGVYGYTIVEKSGTSFILVDQGTYIVGDNSEKFEGVCDAMELIYFRDLTVTVDGTTYHGGWIQWKNPRDW